MYYMKAFLVVMALFLSSGQAIAGEKARKEFGAAPRFIVEVSDTLSTSASFTKATPVLNTWYGTPTGSVLSIDLEPGVWTLKASGVALMALTSPGSSQAFEQIAFASNNADDSTGLLDEPYSVYLKVEDQLPDAGGFQVESKYILLTQPTTIYLKVRAISWSGSPAPSAVGFITDGLYPLVLSARMVTEL